MISAHTNTKSQPPERIAIVYWAAGLGAITAEALADRLDVTAASARARLLAAERERLLERHRPLMGRPALYTVTRTGLRAAGASGLDPCRVSPSNTLHLIECVRVAVALERCYPDHRVQGERELRREEREHGRALASAELGAGRRDEARRHRPDLVLWPLERDGSQATGPNGSHTTGSDGGSPPEPPGGPVAVEVELTVKAPERLEEICRGWARARCVAGVLYIASPEAERAVERAIERSCAHERVVVVPLKALPTRPIERTVPSSA
ncbi:MAG: hypothetical protein ACHQE6_10025 [Solirubrobacterales bacterium]